MSKLLLSSALVIIALTRSLVLGYDSAAYKDPHYVGNRTAMVHLFEWKWRDIATECERFLGPLGYAAVQVSPINENVIIKGRPWFERYQSISYKIATRSGNERDFKDMVARCNAVGVRIFVDVVVNHMTGDHEVAIGTGGSTADPKNLLYPAVPYGPEDFNLGCNVKNWIDPIEVRNCELMGLRDLNQAREHVRNMLVEFFNRAIDLGVAGFRVDAAKQIWPRDLEAISSRLNNLRSDVFGENRRPFVYLEVIEWGGAKTIKMAEYAHLGALVEFNFCREVGEVFRGWQPIRDLRRWLERDYLGTNVLMIDNHDNQRGHGAGGKFILSYKQPRLYKMAVAFMLALPYGHPQLMSSFDFTDRSHGPPADENENIISPDPISDGFANGAEANNCNHGWICEHRWSQIYGMVGFRNVVQDAPFVNWWTNGNNQIGNLGFIAFNGQYGFDLKETLQTSLKPGHYCDVISGRKVGDKCTGKTIKVNDDGTAYIEILKDEADGALAFHAQTKLPDQSDSQLDAWLPSCSSGSTSSVKSSL